MSEKEKGFFSWLDDEPMDDAAPLADMLGTAPAAAPLVNTTPAAPAESEQLGEQDILDAETQAALDDLDPQEFAFLSSYMEHGVAARAARDAGMAYNNPLARNKRLQIALAHIRRSLTAKLKYDVVAAFQDLDDAAKFARANKSPMALTRCLEVKSKIAGHLQEHRVSGKIEHRHTHEITDTRTDDELRAHAAQLARELGLDKSAAIDAEFSEVKKDG